MYKAALSMLERGADPTISMYGGASILTETILAEGNDVVIKDEAERKELLELRAYLVDHGYLK